MENTKVFVDEFAEKLVARIKESGIDIKEYSVEKIYKINDTFKQGLVIKEADSICTPTVYIDRYEKDVIDGESTFNEAVEDALNMYLSSRNGPVVDRANDADSLPKSAKYTLRMVNINKNKHYLENTPIRMLNDELALYVVGELPCDAEAIMSFRVTNDYLKNIGITEEDMFERAFNNLKEEEFEIVDMFTVLGQLCGVPEMIDAKTDKYNPMFVASNKLRTLGAVILARNDILEEFAKEYGDFYILPSSLHELLFIPKDLVPEHADLKELVRSVNETTVKDEDFLSDTVYFYTQNGITVL